MRENRRPWALLAGALGLLWFWSVAAEANAIDQHTFRVLRLGVSQGDIVAKVGLPDRKWRRVLLVPLTPLGRTLRQIQREIWVYDGGCCAPTRVLIFDEGVLAQKEEAPR